MVVFAVVASVLDSLVGVAFGAVGIALAMAASGPNIDALALVQLGEERMADYGRIRGWESLSYAAGCLAFGWLLDLYGVSLALPLYAAAGAVMLVWTTIAVRPDRPKQRAHHGRLGAVGAVFRTAPRMWGFLVATLLVWTGFNGAWNFVGLKIEEPLLIGVGTALGGLTRWGSCGSPRACIGVWACARCTPSDAWSTRPGSCCGARRAARSCRCSPSSRAGFSLLFTTSIPRRRQVAALRALLDGQLDRRDGRLRDRSDHRRGPRWRRLRAARLHDALHRLRGPRPPRGRRGAGRTPHPPARYPSGEQLPTGDAVAPEPGRL